MKNGELIKILRMERGLRQRDLAEGVSTGSAVSNLETKNQYVTFEHLMGYIGRMNVDLEEYVDMLDTPYNEKTKQLMELENLHLKGKNDLQNKITDYAKWYQDTSDVFYLRCLISYQVELLTRFEKEEQKNLRFRNELSEAVLEMTDHLGRLENWGIFEMNFFGNHLHLFESDYICYHFDRIYDRVNSLTISPRYVCEVIHFLFNLMFYCLDSTDVVLARKTLLLMRDLIDDEPKGLYEKTMLLFFEGVYNATFLDSDMSQAVDAVEIFRSLGIHSQVKELERYCV